MGFSGSPSVSSASTHLYGQQEESTIVEEAVAVADSGISSRSAGRRMGRERLLRYVHDVIRNLRQPLHEIVRNHALPFLPVQPLLRLRAVSTSWSRHISSPFFAHTQSFSNRSVTGLLPTSQPCPPGCYIPFDKDTGAVPDPCFRFLPETAVQVRASSRGLVCCSSIDNQPYRRTRYYVCNPATAQWTAIPYSGVRVQHCAIALLFRRSPLNFSADFDLVCVVESDRGIGFEVFSSMTGSWRLSDNVLCGGERLSSSLAISAGGVSYWGTASGAVLSYDPVAGRCRVIRLPEGVENQSSPWRLAEVDGKVCCCCVRRSTSPAEETAGSEVYVLEEGATWTKKRSLDVVGGELWPLILEDGDRQALLAVDGRVVGFTLASGPGRLRRGPQHGVGVDDCFLPYVSSLVHVKQFQVDFDKR